LLDEMPERVTLPIQRRCACIKINQTIKHTLRLARLT
jgi:hypothetical protein